MMEFQRDHVCPDCGRLYDSAIDPCSCDESAWYDAQEQQDALFEAGCYPDDGVVGPAVNAVQTEQWLTAFTVALPTELDEAMLDASLTEAYELLEALTQLSIEVAKAVKHVKRAFVENAGGSKTVVVLDDGRRIEAGFSRPRTWPADERALAVSAVIARATDDPRNVFDEDGTMLPPAVIGERVGKVLVGCFGIAYGRVGALQKLGLDADRYSVMGEYQPQVKAL